LTLPVFRFFLQDWQLLSPENIDKSNKNIQGLLKGEQIRRLQEIRASRRFNGHV
jgi:hypothetical protein